MEFKIDGLEVIGGDHRHTTHKLHDGSTLPITHPPVLASGEIPKATHDAAFPVRSAGNALAALDAARRSAAADKNLSDIGRVQKVQPSLDAARAALNAAQVGLAAVEATAEAAKAVAMAIPLIEKGDLENVFLDQEIRTHARGLEGHALAEYAASLKNNPRHVEAIVRSPTPMGVVGEVAGNEWAATREKSPATARAASYADAVQWGRMTLDQIAKKI